MPEHESRERVTAVVVLLLSLSTVFMYITVEAAVIPSKTVSPVSVKSNARDGRGSGTEHAIASVTAALEKHDFAPARAAAEALAGLPLHRQIMSVIDSADTRWTLEQVASAIRGTYYGEARARASTLCDEKVRRELLDVIDFAEARTAIRTGDIAGGSKLGMALRPGLKRAILFTALAARHSDNHGAALRYATLARKEVPRIDQRYRRRVLAMIANVMLKVDQEYGLTMLDQALHAGEAGGPRGSASGSEHEESGAASFRLAGDGFIEVLSAGGARQAFSLVVPGITADLTQLLIEQHGRIRCVDPKHSPHVLAKGDESRREAPTRAANPVEED